jgi:putative serine protease PepD
MSIRDGVEPSRSPDSDTHTQPLPREPRGEAASENPAPPANPADETWPPSWGESPSSWGQPPAAAGQPAPWGQPPASAAAGPAADGPSWTEPPSAQGPSWTEAQGTQGPTWTEPPGAQGPSWTRPAGPAAGATEAPAAASATDTTRTQPPADAGPSWPGADQPQPGWGQGGGGGHPATPAWGARPADPGSPWTRRSTRWLAAVVAGVVLLAGGYGISQALDRNNAAPAGAGIPTAAPVAASPVPSASSSSSAEPAAAVAKALLPAVVEISHGNGLGSGFVYDKNGYIMTAAHVVQGASEVDVRLYDGTKLSGQVVGTDEANDVAVVKVDRTGLAVAPLGVNDTVQVGQLAVAIGSPFGLNETVTAGIISSTDRILDDGREVIQTDAPINPGNSGGLLANRQGRVIGINDAIRPANDGTDGNVGIGFAIPIDLAAKSATAIVQGKTVQTGYLGVTMAPATGGGDGALVQEVAQGSPADKAGLRVGDLVVAVDGKAVQSYSDLGARIRAHKPGDKVTLKVVRDGNETTITATLAQRPAG